MSNNITVLLTSQPEGGYVVTVKEHPQVITQGETIEEALINAADGIDEVLATKRFLARKVR